MQSQQPLQLALAFGLAHVWIAVLVEHATLGDDRRALPVDLDAATFEHQVGFDAAHAGAMRHERGHLGVQIEVLFLAPTVEIEVDAGLLSRLCHDKHRARIAHPEIIVRTYHEVDLVTHELPGLRHIRLTNQHGNRFVSGDAEGDGGEVAPHLRKKLPAPDFSAGTKRHPRALVRLAFVRHVPTAGFVRHCQGSVRTAQESSAPERRQGLNGSASSDHATLLKIPTTSMPQQPPDPATPARRCRFRCRTPSSPVNVAEARLQPVNVRDNSPQAPI